MSVKKAILPVAGFGTRLLPASKSIPKEMVTVVDRPAIAYVVEEAINAGIEQIILVTHSSKRAIEDYFDSHYELEDTLDKKNKVSILASIKNIVPNHVSIISVRQPQPLGLGHAVLCAASVIGDEPFAVLLPDVLVANHHLSNDLQQMIENYKVSKRAQIMVEEVAADLVSQYGIVDLDQQPIETGTSTQLSGIVEKPEIGNAPSQYAVVGRYILPAKIMQILKVTEPGAGGEIQLTDAIAALGQNELIDAYRMTGKTFDCGSKLGYLEAILNYGINHAELGLDFQFLIKQLKI